MTKNDWKYVIKRVITYMAIAMIMLLLGSCNVKAFSFTTDITLKEQFLIPGGNNGLIYKSLDNNQLTSLVPKFEFNLSNKTVNCDTDYCGVEFVFTGNVISNQNTFKYIFDYFSFTAQINDSQARYPVCSINGNTIGCIVQNGTVMNVLQMKVAPTRIGSNDSFISVNIGLNDTACIYNIYNSGSSLNDIANNTNDINNSLNDDTAPSTSDISSSSSDWSSNNIDSGVINNLVLMPISLLNSVVNGLSGTCSTYYIGELWGENLTLPCINLSNILGTVWTIIDVIMSGVFIFVFGKRCVKIFNDFTNLRSGQIDSLYGGGE